MGQALWRVSTRLVLRVTRPWASKYVSLSKLTFQLIAQNSPCTHHSTTHTKQHPSLNTQIGGNPNLAEVDLCALMEARSVEVRLTLTFVLLFLAFCVFFHNKSYHSSAACEIHSLTLLPYKTSIQQTNQQMFGNPELVDVKLSELTTVANFLVVRDNPSSNGFIVVTTITAPKLTVPPFNPNETTTDHRNQTRATQPAPTQHDQLLGCTWHPMSLSHNK